MLHRRQRLPADVRRTIGTHRYAATPIESERREFVRISSGLKMSLWGWKRLARHYVDGEDAFERIKW